MKLGWIIELESIPGLCPQRCSCCVEHGLGGQTIRITPDRQESGEQPRRSWIPWRLDSQLWDIFLASPITTSRFIILYNLHSHVRHVPRLWLGRQQRPRYAKQIWPWNVALGH